MSIVLKNKEKESKIADLKKQIKELESEKLYNYALIKVVPDCASGIKDRETTIAISEDYGLLVGKCIRDYDYIPELTENHKRPNDGLAPCDEWYRIELTEIEIIIKS